MVSAVDVTMGPASNGSHPLAKAHTVHTGPMEVTTSTLDLSLEAL